MIGCAPMEPRESDCSSERKSVRTPFVGRETELRVAARTGATGSARPAARLPAAR